MGTIEQDHIRFLIALNGRSIWRPRGRITVSGGAGKVTLAQDESVSLEPM